MKYDGQPKFFILKRRDLWSHSILPSISCAARYIFWNEVIDQRADVATLAVLLTKFSLELVSVEEFLDEH